MHNMTPKEDEIPKSEINILVAYLKDNVKMPIRYSKRNFYKINDDLTSVKDPIKYEQIESLGVFINNKYVKLSVRDFLKNFEKI